MTTTQPAFARPPRAVVSPIPVPGSRYPTGGSGRLERRVAIGTIKIVAISGATSCCGGASPACSAHATLMPPSRRQHFAPVGG